MASKLITNSTSNSLLKVYKSVIHNDSITIMPSIRQEKIETLKS